MSVHVWDGKLNTFSVGGAAQLEYLENATLSEESQTVNGASVLYGGELVQETKARARLDCSLFSDLSTGIRISHLDLSAASLGAVNLLSPHIMASLDFNIKMNHVMKAATGLKWEHPQVSGRVFAASLELDIDDASTPDLLLAMFSSTYADRNKTLTFVLNGVSVSMPMRIIGSTQPIEQAGKQKYTMVLGDASGRSGTTVTPSGSTTLLEKAINAYKTVVAFAFQGASTYNIAVSGNMVWDALGLKIEDGLLVPSRMSFLGQGTITGSSVGA